MTIELNYIWYSSRLYYLKLSLYQAMFLITGTEVQNNIVHRHLKDFLLISFLFICDSF